MSKAKIELDNGGNLAVSDTGSGGDCLVYIDVNIRILPEEDVTIFLTSKQARDLAEALIHHADIVDI